MLTGFGAPGVSATHPYMMGFQPGVPMQMQQSAALGQYAQNHHSPQGGGMLLI